MRPVFLLFRSTKALVWVAMEGHHGNVITNMLRLTCSIPLLSEITIEGWFKI